MAKIAFPPQRGAFSWCFAGLVAFQNLLFPQRGAFSWWFVEGLPHLKSCFFHSAERLVGGFPLDHLVPIAIFPECKAFGWWFAI